MTFDIHTPREANGQFAEKTGAAPEVDLNPQRLRGGKNGVFWRENVTSENYDDLSVAVSGFIEDNPDLLSLSKVRVIPAAKLPFEHYEHDPDNPDQEYPLVKFLLHYEDSDGEDRKLAVDFYDTEGGLEREGGIALNDALYDAVYEARVGSQHPDDQFFGVDSGVYAEFGSISRASAYYESARKKLASAEAFFGEDKLDELMGDES